MKEDLFRYRQALSCLAQPLRGYLLDNGNVLADKITEIRLRVNRPVCVQCTSERLYITASGRLSPFYSDSLLKADRQMLESAVHTICAARMRYPRALSHFAADTEQASAAPLLCAAA